MDMMIVESDGYKKGVGRTEEVGQKTVEVMDRREVGGMKEFPLTVITDFEQGLIKASADLTEVQQESFNKTRQQEHQLGIGGLINVPIQILESCDVFKERKFKELLNRGETIGN